ncbi:hypothetical protein GXW82_06725 [Streptacidiphilus sp. 4-A2]|nr:hypothetical protein [Streptacidiphilus sp. 4-A2]
MLLINVATTGAAEETVDALALAVRHVAATAPGFRGSRLLTSVEGDAVNLAAWSSEKEFAAIFDDPEFTRLYGEFAKTTEGAKFRLYRTSRVFSPPLNPPGQPPPRPPPTTGEAPCPNPPPRPPTT